MHISRNHKKIAIILQTKDRPTELALLLQSLRIQTYQDYDIYILDDASGTPIMNYHFLQVLIERLRDEAHKVHIMRNDISKGIAMARQQMLDYVLQNTNAEFMLRIDDDTICEPDYIELLMRVIDQGYDIASGVTPPLGASPMGRTLNYVTPVINRVVLDNEGVFEVNCDDCGHYYLEHAILPADHFRSSALIKRKVHEQIKYEYTLTPCGFREEQFLSFRAILAGFSIGVHTGAINWHLCTPSGGDRRPEYGTLAQQNQVMLNRFVRDKVQKYGNFVEAYHQRLDVLDTTKTKYANLHKNTNLIYSTEV